MSSSTPRRPARPVTLSDVARLAGVSVPTASKAMNGRAQVAESTRAKVLDAATRLSFTPNPIARGLQGGRTGTVGLLTSDLEGRFVLPILMGAEDAFGAGEVNVLLCDARGDAVREQHHLKTLLGRRVDALMVVGRQTDPRPSLGRDLPVPVIYVYAPSDDPADLSLTTDNVGAGRMAVEHLRTTGRRHIAHIGGDPSYAAALDRAQGIGEAMTEAGLSLAAETTFGEWSEGWGRDAAAMLLEADPAIDGLVCASDQIARGALDTARDLGLRVPEDLAVIGFDNWEVLTLNSRPQLTSVDPKMQMLGREAARLLFSALDEESLGSGLRTLPAQLVVRASTVSRR
jgi:LacI family transcriptional regulator